MHANSLLALTNSRQHEFRAEAAQERLAMSLDRSAPAANGAVASRRSWPRWLGLGIRRWVPSTAADTMRA